MELKGKVHCFFEQSGTFKNEFIKLGIPAEDYDLQNNFGQTDHTDDLFQAIDDAYDGKPSLFDNITPDDLILAFFPCINFCDAKTMIFKGVSIFQKKWSLAKMMDKNIEFARERQKFYELLLMLVSICSHRGLRLIIENPWNDSGETYLQRNFIKPTIIDKDRTLRGDVFVKPTAYWFVNCENTIGYSYQKDKEVKIVYKSKDNHKVETGTCSEARSIIHPDYARNFICDFILGREQKHTMKSLFE
jgi:hypothetical protein